MSATTEVGVVHFKIRNTIVHTEGDVRFSENSGVNLSVDTREGELHFQYVLSGHTLRLIVRDMQEDVVLSNIELYDFSKDKNERVSLNKKAPAT